MTSAAARLFESALRRTEDTVAKSVVAAHFEDLIKARKKKAAAAPAPKPENPQVSFGRGSGDRPDDFADRHPHLVHGGTFKLLPSTEGKGKSTPIGPKHPSYNAQIKDAFGKVTHDMTSATEYKVHNPLETVARIGYGIKQKTKPNDQAGWDSPNHPAHLGYVFDQMSDELHPETSQNAAFHAKKPRGMHPQNAIRNITVGNWVNSNQWGSAKDQPRTLHEHMSRIRETKGGNASVHSANLTGAVFRMEQFTRGMNRLFHVARGMGDKFHGDVDHTALHDALTQHDLQDFSGRREVQGFHPEHLSSKHNPSAAADFHGGGKPAWKPHPFFASPKGEPHPMGNEKLNNMTDLADHLMKLPSGHGSSKKFKEEGRELFSGYLPNQANRHRENYARVRGLPKSEE